MLLLWDRNCRLNLQSQWVTSTWHWVSLSSADLLMPGVWQGVVESTSCSVTVVAPAFKIDALPLGQWGDTAVKVRACVKTMLGTGQELLIAILGCAQRFVLLKVVACCPVWLNAAESDETAFPYSRILWPADQAGFRMHANVEKQLFLGNLCVWITQCVAYPLRWWLNTFLLSVAWTVSTGHISPWHWYSDHCRLLCCGHSQSLLPCPQVWYLVCLGVCYSLEISSGILWWKHLVNVKTFLKWFHYRGNLTENSSVLS